MLEAGALGRPRGMVWRGRREEGSGWGTHVYQWRIHIDIWQNQYNIVKLKNKIKLKKIVNIQKTKITASVPITSWQIEGETMEIVTDIIFLGSKITVDDDAAMRLKILAPSKKSYNQAR